MIVSLYSSLASWVVVPVRVEPSQAAAEYGPLTFEGTIHSHLMPSDIWSRIWSEWESQPFACVPEVLGLVLLEAGQLHYGTLTPPFTQAASPLPPLFRPKLMSTLHGNAFHPLGRGELRKPGDYSDQPGQDTGPTLRAGDVANTDADTLEGEPAVVPVIGEHCASG